MKCSKIIGNVWVKINTGMQREGGPSVLVVTIHTVRFNAKNSTFCSHGVFYLFIYLKKKDLLHRKSVRYTGLQNYEIVPLINLP